MSSNLRCRPSGAARRTKISAAEYAAIGRASPYGCRGRKPLQTAFTQEQLARPQIAEADTILRTCVHYGFCTATCPTYVLTRDENESPRGRIDLIRAMLEKGGAPEAETVRHLDSCLSCLS